MRGITAELNHVRELSEIRKGEREDQVIGEATEDGMIRHPEPENLFLSNYRKALKLETLLKLSESSSFDLRAASVFDPPGY